MKQTIILRSLSDITCTREISKNAGKMSKLIADVIEDIIEDGPQTIDIQVTNAHTLADIVTYMEHHWDNKPIPIPKPLTARFESAVSQWDYEFFVDVMSNQDPTHRYARLIALANAANFLNIPELMEFTCAAIASIIHASNGIDVVALFNGN